uniref:Large ribosomal subunit protein eL34 n=1 Tax=Romanomermis culicivorax TaxID=13658 RepID=A0A915IFK6_ROMCU
MVQRLTYRRRLSYNTKSNKRKVSKTPGNKLVYLYTKKQGTIPRCGDCKDKLKGIHYLEADYATHDKWFGRHDRTRVLD